MEERENFLRTKLLNSVYGNSMNKSKVEVEVGDDDDDDDGDYDYYFNQNPKKLRYFNCQPIKVNKKKKVTFKDTEVEEEGEVMINDISELLNSAKRTVENNKERKKRNADKNEKIIVSFDGRCQIYNADKNIFRDCEGIIKNYKPSSILVNVDNDIIFSCGGINKNLINEPRIDECFYYDYDLDFDCKKQENFKIVDVHRLTDSRSSHSATKLNGKKILVAGGWINRHTYFNDSQIIDLDNPQVLIKCGKMNECRTFHTSNLIGDAVLVCGGMCRREVKTTEMFYVEIGEFIKQCDMNKNRSYHSATVLNDGRLMVMGGTSTDPFFISDSPTSTEYFDVREGKFKIGPSMKTRRFGHFSTLLKNGKVLLGGCGRDNVPSTKSTEIFDPIANKFEDSVTPDLLYEFKNGSVI